MLPLFLKNLNNDNVKLTKKRKSKLKELCRKLKIQIRSLSLLDKALTHTSCVEKTVNILNTYERLEFLGDSVLNASVSFLLYNQNPNFREGKLSSFRSSLVDEKTLAKIGIELGLPEYINLGRGEKLSDKRARHKVTSDVLEAIIGVIFLENGFEKAMKFVKTLISGHIDHRLEHGTGDYKTKLQKIAIERFKEYPVYKIVDEKGPDHNKIFEVEVSVKKKYFAKANGRSKKDAEQKSAKMILKQMSGREYKENEKIIKTN